MRTPIIIISTTVVLLLISAGVAYAVLSDNSGKESSPEDVTLPLTTTTTPPTTTTTTTLPTTTTTTPPTTTTTPPPTTTTLPPTTTTPPPTTTTPPPTTTAPPPTTTPPVEPPASSYDQEIEKLKEAITDVAATGESREVVMVFTETVVNDQAAQILVGAKISVGITLEVNDVNIDLQENNIIAAELKGVGYGLWVTIRVTGRLSIQQGKPVVEVIEANVSEEMIADALTQALDSLLTQLTQTGEGGNENVSVEFTDVSVGQDELTLIVMVKPIA